MDQSPPPAPPPPPPSPHPLPAEQHRNWLDLPREVTESILKRLSVIEILMSAQKVCLLWRNICNGPFMWRTINMGYVNYSAWNIRYDFEAMCRHAVDLSCGELLEIKVGCFCTDDLLKYVTESSSELRYLGLSNCYGVSVEGFCEVAANIPLLEELELSYCSTLQDFLEDVGRSCPNLKSLTLRIEVCLGDPFEGCDFWAVTIAENMPGLVSLHLDGNMLTNDGLQAILDACPHLQTLELCRCPQVSLEGEFGRKCSQRIKNLRYHYFSDRQLFQTLLEDSGNYDSDDYKDGNDFERLYLSI